MASATVIEEFRKQQHEITTLVRYYATSGKIRSLIQSISQMLILLSTMAVFASEIKSISSPIVGTISSLLVAFLVVVSYTWNHPHKLTVILTTSEKCRDAERAVRSTRARLEAIDDNEAMDKWTKLQETIDLATAPVERAGIGYSSYILNMAKKRVDKMTPGNRNRIVG